MSAIAKVPVRMTVAEFLAWDTGDGRPWQLWTESRRRWLPPAGGPMAPYKPSYAA